MIVAGFGFRTGATVESLHLALEGARDGRLSITHLAAPQDKLPLLEALAQDLGLPVIGVGPGALTAIETPSRFVPSLAERGVGSVSEAAALAAVGSGARLIVHRSISSDRMATCAIAQGPTL
ncbi:cobalt-precorrin 5A hydrolase [Sphingobium sp. AP50]|uniref:cobalamin biosynthesis protein n=1 Tax=Sphingobium sp. AP50 TaxID=1884369 RepID=UPI0008BF2D1C|nr:cobalamin biosynthesis protein [Sphingobium sp. AP50]SEJ88285.1 cobalt-precorrin 5A hydrolase [Sphingobium sp. AP50]